MREMIEVPAPVPFTDDYEVEAEIDEGRIIERVPVEFGYSLIEGRTVIDSKTGEQYMNIGGKLQKQIIKEDKIIWKEM